jgi:hypothetical protein
MSISNKQKIIIVGAGWYGMHSADVLKNKYDILILEKQSDIFNNSSYYNQNRLHLGYHYPRSYATRKICLEGYNKFMDKYSEIVDDVDNNYYVISYNSIIDYETYLDIFNANKKYTHHIIENKGMFEKIDGNIIKTSEKIINSKKAYNYFKNKIDDKIIKFNYKVENIKNNNNNKIIVNDELECDFLLDCTYNQLNLDKTNYSYELTISLIYKKDPNCNDFDALTCMDGDFFSIYPREIENGTYTLTHVKYTPLIKSANMQDISNFILTEDILKETIKNMENEVDKYYKNFLKYFEYQSYFTSYKCKKISGNDNRDITINNANNIISVNCGKITGIFCLEDYLSKYFEV